jgi:hypothetical protein
VALDSFDALGWLRKHLEQDDPDLVRDMVKRSRSHVPTATETLFR